MNKVHTLKSVLKIVVLRFWWKSLKNTCDPETVVCRCSSNLEFLKKPSTLQFYLKKTPTPKCFSRNTYFWRMFVNGYILKNGKPCFTFWRSFVKRQTSSTSSDNEWQRMTSSCTTSDNEWQRVTTSDTTSDKEWQRMARVTASESSGTANENGTVHFKEWMIVIIWMTKRDTLLRQGMDGCNYSG